MRLNSSGRMTWPLASASPGMPISSRKSRKRRELFRVRRIVHPVHAGLVPRLQLLGRRDIGEDHEFLDQPVAVEPGARHDRDRPPLAVEHDPVLGQVELQRAARPPGPVERGEGAVQRGQPLGRERQRPTVCRRGRPAPPRRSAAPPSA